MIVVVSVDVCPPLFTYPEDYDDPEDDEEPPVEIVVVAVYTVPPSTVLASPL